MTNTTSEGDPAVVVGSYGFNPPVGTDALADHAEQVRAATENTIMVGELHHRLQNTLAVVLALSRLTARTVDTVAEFQKAFAPRINALARTHGLLLRGQVQAVTVRAALEGELLPYLSDDEQVTLTCDLLHVSADVALNLSLIFHELATNAAKYGALADRSGRLVVTCTRDGSLGHVHWQEFLAEPVTPSSRVGAGTLLITKLARSLNGTSKVELLPNGLDAKITFTLGETQTISAGGGIPPSRQPPDKLGPSRRRAP